jgi:hypothetical protein
VFFFEVDVCRAPYVPDLVVRKGGIFRQFLWLVRAKRREVSSIESKLSTKWSNYFSFYDANEILERGLYDDAIKPGSIVVDGTDIVDDGSD